MNKLTVLRIEPGELYKFTLSTGSNLYMTDDYYDSRISKFELEKDESILVIQVHPTRNGYFAVKVIAKEKMGWLFVESTDELFIPLEEAHPDEYKEAMEIN